jgi:hypothetical protein
MLAAAHLEQCRMWGFVDTVMKFQVRKSRKFLDSQIIILTIQGKLCVIELTACLV